MTSIIILIVTICILLCVIGLFFVLYRKQRYVNKEQLEEIEHFKREVQENDLFIANFSHKLRTSLNNITLINQLVHDDRMANDQGDLVDALRTSTSNLSEDVNELVEIATPAFAEYKQSILSFNLHKAMNQISGILASDMKAAVQLDHAVAQEIDHNLIGDPSLLRSVLINLIKALEEHGLNDNHLLLRASLDNETQNIFNIRFQLDSNIADWPILEKKIQDLQNSTDKPTSGLLPIALRLLALTGSKLEFSADPSHQQLSFIQQFPKDVTRKTENVPQEQSTPGKGKKPVEELNVLLVEDNAINQKIVLLSLDKKVKHIDVANNGKEALDMFGTKKYDLILMDIQMPVMDGITATKKMRELETTTEDRVPIIAITANALAGDRDHCLAAGADDYLSKPFQVEELVDRISSLL